MAVRLSSYLALLYEDLIDRGELEGHHLLPPVLPLVLYNGAGPWRAPTELGDLIVKISGGVNRYSPSLRYLVIDQHRYATVELQSVRNLVAALFLLEKSRHARDLEAVVDRLIDWLEDPGDAELQRSFASWLTRVLLPARLPKARIPRIEELKELKTMLDFTWTEVAKAEGRLEGEAAMLLRQLAKRFGSLTESVKSRVTTADAEALLVWSERVLDAERLEQVFAD